MHHVGPPLYSLATTPHHGVQHRSPEPPPSCSFKIQIQYSPDKQTALPTREQILTKMKTVFATEIKPKKWQVFTGVHPLEQSEKEKKLSFLNRYNFKPQRELVRGDKTPKTPYLPSTTAKSPLVKRPAPKANGGGLCLKSHKITLLDGRQVT